MHYTWLGHASIRLEIGGQVLLIDPWESGNPVFPAEQRAELMAGATAILLTHGHGDHATDAVAWSKELGVPIYGIYDLMSHWEAAEAAQVVGFNKGGTVMIGDVAVTMVNACHSSSIGTDHGPMYAGAEAGFMITGEGRTVYVSGDTDVMADMAILQDLHAPEIGIVSAGGHFTMDMKRAAYAATKLFKFKTVIPVHYKTFPLLAQSADELAEAAPDAQVLAPEIGERISI